MSSSESHPGPLTRSTEDSILFTLTLGRALHECGTPAHRIEEAMQGCAQALGLKVQVFSTPTSIHAGFGPIDRQTVSILRVQPGELNLERLAEVDKIASTVSQRRLSTAEGFRRLEAILNASTRYSPSMLALAYALGSMVAARFFGGGLHEVVSGGAIGLVVGVLAVTLGKYLHLGRLVEFVAGAIAAAMALLFARAFAPLSTYTATIAGLIVLLPGMTLTLAMNELATRNLVSGTARLMYALMIFFALGFGVALGRQLESVLPDPGGQVTPLPAWTELAALAAAPLAFTVLFKAHPRHLPVIAGAVLLAFGATRVGSAGLGAEVGVCIGAFVVGSASNLYARLTDLPSTIPMVPGLLVLVPGSIGFRSLDALLEREVVSGVGTAFQMVMVAAALVAGLLVANVAVTPRKAT